MLDDTDRALHEALDDGGRTTPHFPGRLPDTAEIDAVHELADRLETPGERDYVSSTA